MPRPPSTGGVTSPFGPRVAPLPGASTNHLGEDTVGDGNYWPVHGVIIYAGYYGSWGNITGIRQEPSPEPDGAMVIWWVAHNAEIPGDAKYGEWGDEGDWLAPLGATGNVTGPHAHTERRVGGSYVPGTGRATNPRDYYTAGAGTGGTTPISGGDDEMQNYILLNSGADNDMFVTGQRLVQNPSTGVFRVLADGEYALLQKTHPEIIWADWSPDVAKKYVAVLGLLAYEVPPGAPRGYVGRLTGEVIYGPKDRRYPYAHAVNAAGGDLSKVAAAAEEGAKAGVRTLKVPTAAENGAAARAAIVKQ